MKKLFPFIFILFSSSILIGQNTFIQGRIINSKDQHPISSANVIRMDSLYDVSSDKNGFFKISVPEREEVILIFTHPEFELQTIEITPELLKTPLLIKLVPDEISQTESLPLKYKNTLAFSPIELLFLGLTFEYERRITLNHATGSYATALLNQGVWMAQTMETGVRLKGIKIEPFYRFYVRSGDKDIGFGQVKLVYANFIVTEKYSNEPTTSTPAQAFGIGLAWGWKLMHSKFPRHSIEIVLGAKFVPFITEDESINDLIKNYRRDYWWNVIGPGAVFDVKLSLGGIF